MRGLSEREKQLLAPYIPAVDLENARIVDGPVPWYLLRSFRAIVRGNTIFFRRGAYDPGTVAGIALLGHELVHVGQYRKGMHWLKYLWAARYGYRSSRYEREAYALQRKIANELSAADVSGDGCRPPSSRS